MIIKALQKILEKIHINGEIVIKITVIEKLINLNLLVLMSTQFFKSYILHISSKTTKSTIK